VLQVVFTNIFAIYMHYLVANIVAIGLAEVLNYLVNDAWTFGFGRSQSTKQSEPVVGPKP